MTDATPAPAAEGTETATAATTAETTASSTPETKTSDTDAAKSGSASADSNPGGETTDEVPEVTALSKEERRKYSEALKLLPPEQRKTFNQILDYKNKQAAEARKEREEAQKKAEVLADTAKIIEALDADPDGSLKLLTERFGKKTPTETPKPKATAETLTAEELKAIEEQLDESSKPLAKSIGPIAKLIAKQMLAPVLEDLQSRQTQAQNDEAKRELDAFEAENPDWKEFEPDMVAWAAKFPRAEGVSIREYTAALYTLASAGPKQTAATKEGAKAALKAVAEKAKGAEPDTKSVSPARVVRKVPSSLRESYEMAKRGEEVEAFPGA